MTNEVELIVISRVFSNIRDRWIACFLSAVVVLCIGASLVILLPKKYEAQALIEVDWGMGGAQARGSFLEDSFVGSFLGNMGNSDLEIHRAVETVLSREFVGDFLQTNNLMPLVFHKYWNSETSSWEAPFNENPPTRLQGHSRFLSLLTVEIQDDTNFVSFTLRHREPDKALALLSRFIEKANRFLHDRELIRSEKVLLAVEKSLARSQSQFIKNTMVQAFRTEVQKKVLLDLESELPFRIVDKPVLPENPSWPNKSLILLLSLFFVVIMVLSIGLYDAPNGRSTHNA